MADNDIDMVVTTGEQQEPQPEVPQLEEPQAEASQTEGSQPEESLRQELKATEQKARETLKKIAENVHESDSTPVAALTLRKILGGDILSAEMVRRHPLPVPARHDQD